MAKRADIIVGANFGDEGKGLVTDFLAHPYAGDCIVVRHNGGAQAGHTVTTPDGKRHVFKHFGSGSFSGAKTYLSRYFTCNPILYFQELEKLHAFGIQPKVYIDPQSPLTTPYDMMINQIVEEYRGAGRHGSCGVGFGETIEREQNSIFGLKISDGLDMNAVRSKLEYIRTRYLPERLDRLGVATLSKEWEERVFSDQILSWYLEKLESMIDMIHLSDISILKKYDGIVFESAQGLLLDQDYGSFPHVTRSHTGIKNALCLSEEAEIDTLDVTYITRAYCTRHGAGPLPHELSEKPYKGIEDQTNIYNQYQGSLRFADLDLDILRKSIWHDLSHAKGHTKIRYYLAVTCLDQIDESFRYVFGGGVIVGEKDGFLGKALSATGAHKLITSHGPTRDTMKAS
jgi:adenylosuccinate synthase